MVSKYCRCGYANDGRKLCPRCSRDLTIAVMPDLNHIQDWDEIISQYEELRSYHHGGPRQFFAVLRLLEEIISDAKTALASAERGVMPYTRPGL